MRILEFERTTGLKRSTIRFYERLGLLAPDGKAAGNGYRSYGSAEVERAMTIRLAQSLGFSLAEIRNLVAAWEHGKLNKARRRTVVAEKISDVERKLAALGMMKTYLEKILTWIDGGELGAKPVFGELKRELETSKIGKSDRRHMRRARI